jgi:hypothetical protein
MRFKVNALEEVFCSILELHRMARFFSPPGILRAEQGDGDFKCVLSNRLSWRFGFAWLT